MGVVVAARHVELDEQVALKFLRDDLAASEVVIARFTQEARASVKLKSEYVARTFDVGTESGVPYIVMEYLEGTDLGDELARAGRLPLETAASYLIQACAGVAAAHARGIVHGDIKPENLFLAERGDGSAIVKILDFGISRATSITSGRTEANAPVAGSPAYMSPEQLTGAEMDYRSDIWSLGAVLFELVSGTMPFDLDRPIDQLARAVQSAPHRKLGELLPAAPPELESIVDRCLQKSASSRIQSAAELAIALLPFAPKSARVAAERASSVTRAAGLTDEQSVALPPSTAPAPPLEASSAPAIPRASPVPSIGLDSERGLQERAARPTTHGGATTDAEDARVTAREVGARQRSRRAITLGIAGALLAAGALGAAMFGRQRLVGAGAPTKVAQAAPAPPPAGSLALPAAAPVAAAPVSTTVQLAITASPPNATIFVDGAKVRGNPYSARYPKDGVHHVLRVEARGFVTRSQDVVFDRDADVTIALDKPGAVFRPAAKPAPVEKPVAQSTQPPPPPAPAADPSVPTRPKRLLSGEDPYKE